MSKRSLHADTAVSRGGRAERGTADGPDPAMEAPQILRTKLHPPRIPPDLVSRDRLLKLLAGNPERPFTLVSAPAGYGKTTLVALWLGSLDLPAAWLSLDREDQDLRRFLSQFVAAVRTCCGQACADTLALLEAAELPAAATIARYLGNDLEALPERLIVVLDDYHRADTPKITEVIDYLLRHPPRSLHLVVITRRDPALALAKLRAVGGMGEIRETDLRFDREETRAVLENISEVSVGEQVLDSVHAQLEGWGVGLRLVCLALRGREAPEAYLESMIGGPANIQDYLTEEVLNRQTPVFRQWLMKVSILNCFTAPLCGAICHVKVASLEEDGAIPEDEDSYASTDGHEFLRRLGDANLFCVGLDAQGDWFRFHHQFQHLLRRQLESRADADEIATLHRRACEWFENEGMTDEAIEHALATGDEELATRIVEQCRRAELDEDRWMGVEEWLTLLPEHLKNQHPELLLAQAWVAYFRLQTARIPQLVSRVDSLVGEMTQPDPFWLAELNFFKAVVFYWEGRGEESRRCCEAALALFGEKRGMLGGEVRLYQALACNLCGQGKEAIETIEQDFRMDDAADFAFSTRMMAAKGFVHLLSGDLGPVAGVAERLVSIAERWPSKYAEAWGRFPLALARFHAHQLDDALKDFRALVALRDFFERRAVIDAYGGLMLTFQFQGRSDDATALADELAAFARDLTDPECQQVEASCRIRLALLQGDLKTAVGWARSVEVEPQELGVLFWLEEPAVTLARVLIAEGSKAGLCVAGRMLGELRSQAESRHLTCQLIDILVLQAAALERQERPEGALEVLADALAMARPGGWIRPFVEVGAALAGPLEQLRREEANEFQIGQILSARGMGGSGLQVAGPSPRPDQALVEPLTNRELDVLELLAERLYDKEIADRLSISPQTVRSHLKNLFGKLGVGDRRQAVSKGRQFGLLRPGG